MKKILENFEYSQNLNKNYDKGPIWGKLQKDVFKNIDEEKLTNFRNSLLAIGTDYGLDNNRIIIRKFDEIKFNKSLEFHNIKFDNIKKYLSKKNIGNHKYLFKKDDFFIGKSDFKNFEKIQDLIKYCFSVKEINYICEIGGGFGELARMIFVELPNVKYFLIDLPETNVLTHYYLSKLFPNKNLLCDIDCKANTINKRDVLDNDIFILSPKINFANDIKFDLFINAQSMMEMKINNVNNYFEFIHKHINSEGFFYNINRYYHDGSGDKVVLSQYPYDRFWSVKLSKKYKTSKRSHILLTQRTRNKDTNLANELNKIKNIERNFRPPNLPVSIIRLYRIFKKIFNANK